MVKYKTLGIYLKSRTFSGSNSFYEHAKRTKELKNTYYNGFFAYSKILMYSIAASRHKLTNEK